LELTREEEKFFIDFIAKIAIWTDPRIVKEIQVVYPLTRRKSGVKEKRNTVVNGLRVWDNQPARLALRIALGHEKTRGVCTCHIFQETVHNPRYFSNLANLIEVPKDFESLTELECVNRVLMYRSYELYGPIDLNGEVPSKPQYYPRKWRTYEIMPKEVKKRIEKLKRQRRTRPEFRRLNL